VANRRLSRYGHRGCRVGSVAELAGPKENIPVDMSRALELPAADVFITHELYKRAPRKTDYLHQKLALQDLAARMVD
jgi:hypothetical protein